jgi:ketosteroid isomerase-like protein
MSQENVEIVQAMYDAYLRGDGGAARDACHPEIEWDGRHLPGGRVYHGHAGVREFFRIWQSSWDHFSVRPEKFFDAGDQVVVITRESARRSGLEITEQHGEIYTLANGKIVHWRGFADPTEALEAAGLSE